MGILEGEYEIQGAFCNLVERLALLCEVCPVPNPDTMQAGAQRHAWVTIGVGGTNKLDGAYVRCVVAPPRCGPA